ncbi:MAG: tRNA (guanine(10)-N(2))-dimethyltransferase [Candidatus Aenigmatarchaeota archaeon]
MKLKKIKEGKAKIWIPMEDKHKASVFYNPEAELLRDLSISAIQVFQKDFDDKISICDALSGTGARGLRYAKEIKNAKEVVLNDNNPVAVRLIKKNIKENKLTKKCKTSKSDANVLLHQNVFVVIDIDPFGSPVNFLDSAARSIHHKGLLCVTATDQAPLSGTYPLKCLKKYGLKSMKTEYYAELGIRILLTNIILALSKRERAFIPMITHSDRHYFRTIGRIESLGKINDLVNEFGYVMHCSCGNRVFGKIKEKCSCGKDFQITGPLYLGEINNKTFCKKVLEDLKERKFALAKKEEKLLDMLIAEAGMPPFYYDIHCLAKAKGFTIPKTEVLLKKLRKKGFKASRTHFCLTAIKTDADFKSFKKLLKF